MINIYSVWQGSLGFDGNVGKLWATPRQLSSKNIIIIITASLKLFIVSHAKSGELGSD